MWWLLAAFGALTAGRIAGKLRYLMGRKTRRKAVESCGFEAVKGGNLTALEVRAGSETLRIEDRQGRTVVCVPGPPGLSGMKIHYEGYRFPAAREIETGDELFDSKFSIEGPEQLLRGLLDAETRRLLLGLSFDDRLETSLREIRVETSNENLQSVLPLVLAIGRGFARRTDIAQRLSENARDDPEAGVRLRNLLLLVREHRGKSPTYMALRKACSDPAPEIRLRAAMALEGDHSGILVELAESLADDAVSAEAVSALDRALPFERTRAILDQALDRRLVRTARACLEALGRSGDPAAVDVLAGVMAREGGRLAAAAALALRATGSPAAEPPLIDSLQREQADLRVAAASALGRVGSAAAVLPLKAATERSSWLDLGFRRATRQAIAEIQSRLQGASPGQLSLAEGEAGQLSLAEGEAGQLSLASSEAGRLSLAQGEVSAQAEAGGTAGRTARKEPAVRPV